MLGVHLWVKYLRLNGHLKSERGYGLDVGREEMVVSCVLRHCLIHIRFLRPIATTTFSSAAVAAAASSVFATRG